MNPFEIMQLAMQIYSTVKAAEAKKLNNTEALKYLAARRYAKLLQDKNPGIVELVGYTEPIAD